MKVHFSHKRPYLQARNALNCFSWICFIIAGILILFDPPVIEDFRNFKWPSQHAGLVKQFLVAGLGLKSLKYLFDALYLYKIYDWSLVFPELAGLYHRDGSINRIGKHKNKSVTEELDRILESHNILYSKKIRTLDELGRDIFQIRLAQKSRIK